MTTDQWQLLLFSLLRPWRPSSWPRTKRAQPPLSLPWGQKFMTNAPPQTRQHILIVNDDLRELFVPHPHQRDPFLAFNPSWNPTSLKYTSNTARCRGKGKLRKYTKSTIKYIYMCSTQRLKYSTYCTCTCTYNELVTHHKRTSNEPQAYQQWT